MKLPDTDISPLMWIELDDGIGAIHSATIMCIIPDTSAPKTKSLMITTMFPDGITVKGKAMDVLMGWWELIQQGEDEDELEIDGMTYQTIGDIIAEHFAEDIEDEVLDGLKLVPKDND
tara:strand:- start:4949 stop:5302 length:354 start_codon:yes stop_codon:yes gene_type:complete